MATRNVGFAKTKLVWDKPHYTRAFDIHKAVDKQDEY